MDENNDFGAKFYRPSGIFNPKGTVAFFLLTFILTTVIYAVYTLFNVWCKMSILKLASALCVGLLLGKIITGLVKKFEIREPFIVAFCCIVGMLGAAYLKLGFYDWLDLNKYYYTPLKETRADEYYKLNEFFPEGVKIHKYYKEYHNVTAESVIDFSKLSWEERKALEGKTIWEIQDFDKLLGTTENEVKVSLERAKTLNGYDFTFDYRKAYEKRNLLTILASPNDIIKDVKQISKEGRWSILSGFNKINGDALRLLWLAEFVFFTFYPLYKGLKKAGEPYIESEQCWAKHIDMNKRCKITANGCKTKIFKQIIMADPDILIENLIPGNSKQKKYYSVELWESKDMSENYISVCQIKNHIFHNSRSNNSDKHSKRIILKYMYVEKEFVSSFTKKAFEMQVIGYTAGNSGIPEMKLPF